MTKLGETGNNINQEYLEAIARELIDLKCLILATEFLKTHHEAYSWEELLKIKENYQYFLMNNDNYQPLSTFDPR